MNASSIPLLWTPILTGPLRVACEAALMDLVARLSEPAEAGRFEGSLALGTSGAALFFHYLDRQYPGRGYQLVSSRLIQSAVGDLSESTYGPGLFTGFTGVAWVAEHIRATDDEDPNEDIDKILTEFMNHRPWKGSYDLVEGLVGIGFYGLERLPSASGYLILKRVLDHLDDLKKAVDSGFTWLTPPDLLSVSEQKLYPRGYFNLGLAHGVPGIIALLGQFVKLGVERERALPLLAGAVSWMLSQNKRGANPSSFGTTIPTGFEHTFEPNNSRLAWCYGDLGISISLFWAAREVGRLDWEQAAIELALACGLRSAKDAGDLDAGLCHGAAGIAHIFNRLYQASGEEVFLHAAQTWFQRTLEYRMDGEGVAGFRAFRPPQHDSVGPIWVDKWGLIDGAVGIALSLLSGISTFVPDWDRSLAIAIPPCPSTFMNKPKLATTKPG